MEDDKRMTLDEALAHGRAIHWEQLYKIDLTAPAPQRYLKGRPSLEGPVEDEGDVEWQPHKLSPGWPKDGWEPL